MILKKKTEKKNCIRKFVFASVDIYFWQEMNEPIEKIKIIC